MIIISTKVKIVVKIFDEIKYWKISERDRILMNGRPSQPILISGH